MKKGLTFALIGLLGACGHQANTYKDSREMRAWLDHVVEQTKNGQVTNVSAIVPNLSNHHASGVIFTVPSASSSRVSITRAEDGKRYIVITFEHGFVDIAEGRCNRIIFKSNNCEALSGTEWAMTYKAIAGAAPKPAA